MRDLKEVVEGAACITIIGFALMLAFGGGILHGFVDLCHWLGAK